MPTAPIRTAAPSPRSRAGHGVAALFVTVMLCFAMVLAVAVAHRNVVVEEQRSANELRAASAFEAASRARVGARAHQRPVPDRRRLPAERRRGGGLVSRTPGSDRRSVGRSAPRTWMDGATPAPVQAACVRGADG